MKNNGINIAAEEIEEVTVIENAGMRRTASVIDRILKVFQVAAIVGAVKTRNKKGATDRRVKGSP